MAQLSAHMAAVAERPLLAEVIEHTKHHLLDTLGAVISGSELAPGTAAVAYAPAHAGPGKAPVGTSTLRCTAAIDERRLTAMPAAAYCVACQAVHEHARPR